MTRQELAAKIAQDTGVTKITAEAAIDSLLDGVTRALKKGDTVTLVGFGSFKTTIRPARQGRHPVTGAPLAIPKARVPRFSPGQSLRKAVSGR